MRTPARSIDDRSDPPPTPQDPRTTPLRQAEILQTRIYDLEQEVTRLRVERQRVDGETATLRRRLGALSTQRDHLLAPAGRAE